MTTVNFTRPGPRWHRAAGGAGVNSAIRSETTGATQGDARSALVLKVVIVATAAMSSMASSISPEFATRALKMLGAVLIGCLVWHLRRRPTMLAEVRFYFAFVVWAFLSGLVVSVDLSLTFRAAWTATQMGILLWAATVAHRAKPDLTVIMAGVWAIGMLHSGLAVMGQAVDSISKETGGRMIVMGQNPNSTGQMLLFAGFAALYLADRFSSWLVKIPMFGSLPVLFGLLLFTGSRKMLLGAVLVGGLWVAASLMRPARNLRGFLGKILVVACMVTSAGVVGLWWEDSPVAQRYEERHRSVDERMSLYQDGLSLFVESPVAGVGLMNQVVLMSGEAHCDFVDVLCSTGAVGAFLYFSLYVVAVIRSWRAWRNPHEAAAIGRRYFYIYIVLIFWLMFGFSRYLDLLHIVVFGSLIGAIAWSVDSADAGGGATKPGVPLRFRGVAAATVGGA